LLAIAEEHAKPAWIACSAAALPPGLDSFNTRGLSAGTSTPDALINEIEQGISQQAMSRNDESLTGAGNCGISANST
jgi:4-hydroxy-3-methylbut-2-enyl diphosphate reductase IspH